MIYRIGRAIDTVVTAPNRIRFHTEDVHLLLEKIHSECFRNTMLSPVLPILRNNMPDRRLWSSENQGIRTPLIHLPALMASNTSAQSAKGTRMVAKRERSRLVVAIRCSTRTQEMGLEL